MNKGGGGEGGLLYRMATMEREPVEIERKRHERGNVVTAESTSEAQAASSTIKLFPNTNIVYKTPPPVRLARFFAMEVCWTIQQTVAYKASLRTTTKNSISRGSQSNCTRSWVRYFQCKSGSDQGHCFELRRKTNPR